LPLTIPKIKGARVSQTFMSRPSIELSARRSRKPQFTGFDSLAWSDLERKLQTAEGNTATSETLTEFRDLEITTAKRSKHSQANNGYVPAQIDAESIKADTEETTVLR
jgi:hypothetical protein